MYSSAISKWGGWRVRGRSLSGLMGSWSNTSLQIEGSSLGWSWSSLWEGWFWKELESYCHLWFWITILWLQETEVTLSNISGRSLRRYGYFRNPGNTKDTDSERSESLWWSRYPLKSTPRNKTASIVFHPFLLSELQVLREGMQFA